MEAFEIGILLLGTVLVSSIIAQFFEKLSLPLVQIAMGVILSVVTQNSFDIRVQPELFLVLFIAPLLFDEAKKADKEFLWKHKWTLVSFAVGLVIAIVIGVGTVTHLLIPALPLAAAFALGAALGPTDPVAVASVSKDAHISERNSIILQGESLINDASGLVAFQFAIAAVTTGAFSLLDASASFAIKFFGGIFGGLIMGVVIGHLSRVVRDNGLEHTTFHVLLDICTPFIVYLLAEQIHISGIIAVVVAGVASVLFAPTAGPHTARTNIVSTSVWKVLTFALNGIVFVLLGAQIPMAMSGTWNDPSIDNVTLLVLIVIITAVLLLIRFLWSLGSIRIDKKLVKQGRRELREGEDPSLHMTSHDVREAAVLAFAGAKGAITLAIMMTLPYVVDVAGGGTQAFPLRSTLIFLASGVILLTLLLATIVVPLLAPKTEEDSQMSDRDRQTRLDIVRTVMERVAAGEAGGSYEAIERVVMLYRARIERMKSRDDLADVVEEDEAKLALRLMAIDWEWEFVQEKIDTDQVSMRDGYEYLGRLARLERLFKHDAQKWEERTGRTGGRRARLTYAASRWIASLRGMLYSALNALPVVKPTKKLDAFYTLSLESHENVIEKLRDYMAGSDEPSEAVASLMAHYQAAVNRLRAQRISISSITAIDKETTDIQLEALRFELEEIQDAYNRKELSSTATRRMRENVFLMQMDLQEEL